MMVFNCIGGMMTLALRALERDRLWRLDSEESEHAEFKEHCEKGWRYYWSLLSLYFY